MHNDGNAPLPFVKRLLGRRCPGVRCKAFALLRYEKGPSPKRSKA